MKERINFDMTSSPVSARDEKESRKRRDERVERKERRDTLLSSIVVKA
jgi:hypothetical protein